MDEKKNLAQGQAVFATLCSALDKAEWKYEKNEEKLHIKCGVKGDDFDIDIIISVDAERRLTMLYSHLPFVVGDDKRLDLAIAVSAVNNILAHGCFDYDISDGHMFFRMANTYNGCTPSEAVFTYMLFASCQTIDEYNDKFFMLAKGMITIEQFLEKLAD